jgi:hypothetical protein
MNPLRGMKNIKLVATAVVVGALLGGASITSGWAAGAVWPGSEEPRADAAAKKKKKKPAPRRLAAPRLQAPAANQAVQAMPTFTWAKLRGAVRYEFQLAADAGFRSIVDRGSFQTRNTAATVERTFANSTYHWRVRGIDKANRAGRWTSSRAVRKQWSTQPELISPSPDTTVEYPRSALLLRWTEVPRAHKYLVTIATDPALASPVMRQTIETSANVFALPGALPPGRYYWAVTPTDAQGHKGAQSAVWSFDWSWTSRTPTRLGDLDPDPRVMDPQFAWDAVAGAARYEVEINASRDFAAGARVCCDDTITGTEFSPRQALPNNEFFWRVRAFDVDGNAGQWNEGPRFRKEFNPVAPTIPGLRLFSNETTTDPLQDLMADPPATSIPLVRWDPVPGASSYQVVVAPWTYGVCNWTTADSTRLWNNMTATTGWTPLSYDWTGRVPGGVSYPRATADRNKRLRDGESYCVRVLARADRDGKNGEIVSGWTQLGGAGRPAFTYREAPATTVPSGPLFTTRDHYLAPQSGAVEGRMPVFRWRRVEGARSYYVVVARDSGFTHVVDVAITNVPAYAPRDRVQPTTYSEENDDGAGDPSRYYWAVLPSPVPNGDLVGTEPRDHAPQGFQKRTAQSELLAPGSGPVTNAGPTFRWTRQEGARKYRLQVSRDPSFGQTLEDVTTSATSYTSAATLPADTRLYWRVRGNDEELRGLSWSRTGEFERRLPVPQLEHDTPTAGTRIPSLAWAPVPGAVGYELSVDQADGTRKSFKLRSTAFTPVGWYGTGVWNWRVRAQFPSGRSQTVWGGNSSSRPFTRLIATPGGLRRVNSGGRATFSWQPTLMAKRYRVEVSDSDSFARAIDRVTTDNTSYAPRLDKPAYTSGKPVYWRVATIDEGGNVGGFATGVFHAGRTMQVRTAGTLRRGRTSRVTVSARHKGKAISGATVTLTGAGVRASKKTGRTGKAAFRVTPRAGGNVRVQVTRSGYAASTRTLKVR